MHHRGVEREGMTKASRHLLSVACLVAIGSLALFATAALARHRVATTKTKAFAGNICATVTPGEVSAASVDEPCTRVKTIKRPPKPVPILGGSYGYVRYGARWGDPGGEPARALRIRVTKVEGSGRVLALDKREWRKAILTKGKHVNVGSIGSVQTETTPCVNPPTGDCTEATLLAVVGNYQIMILLQNHPPTEESAAPTPVEPDEAEDKAQEGLATVPLVAIGRAVAESL
jgi:hypothetical protein